MMTKCWTARPEERISFTAALTELEQTFVVAQTKSSLAVAEQYVEVAGQDTAIEC